MQILFIDDDEEDFHMFCEALQVIKPNTQCIHEQNGATGLRYLQRSTRVPDYIFLDIHMPVMTGIECLKKIKADERLKDIPVIMYTSDTDPRWSNIQIKRYQDLGATHVMSKASTFQEIVEMLKAFFG